MAAPRKQERKPDPDAGKYVVLERVHHEGHDPAWQVVELHVEAGSDRKAIVKVAGKPGTPDARPGVYRAVPQRNWRGQANYERPPEPLVDMSWTD